MFTIYYDDLQEGVWFREFDARFVDADLQPISGATDQNPALEGVLAFDRPDIILAASGTPIQVIERTIEVPSGHNVGQRFARLAAAARAGVPLVYFGPYAAYKHGGATQRGAEHDGLQCRWPTCRKPGVHRHHQIHLGRQQHPPPDERRRHHPGRVDARPRVLRRPPRCHRAGQTQINSIVPGVMHDTDIADDTAPNDGRRPTWTVPPDCSPQRLGHSRADQDAGDVRRSRSA